MTLRDIAHQRLLHQRIAQPKLERSSFEHPHQVVRWMGAMQAQDYGQALWAVALRTVAATQADVERAIAERRIVLTWPMRGTIHLVAATDVRWMLDLCAPRKLAADGLRLRQLELDEQTLSRCEQLFREALAGRPPVTRSAMLGLLERSGISPAGQRGYHILWRLAQSGLICFGPRQGKEQTFVLLEEWLPDAPVKSRDDSLAALAERYFASHGPATVHDFAVWTGLTLRDARAGLESVQGGLVSESRDGLEYWWADGPAELSATQAAKVHLLPGFDEYLLGYKHRQDVIAAEHAARIAPGGNGVFLPMIVAGGRVLGTWKRKAKKSGVQVTLEPFLEIDALEDRAREAVMRYGAFVGLPLLP